MKTDQLLTTFILFGLLCVIPAKSGVLDPISGLSDSISSLSDSISGLSDPIRTPVNNVLDSTNSVLIPQNPGCINNTACIDDGSNGLSIASGFIRDEKKIGQPISIGPLQNIEIIPGETFNLTLVNNTVCSKFNYNNNSNKRRDSLTIQVDDVDFTGTIDLLGLTKWLKIAAPIIDNPFSTENCPSVLTKLSLRKIVIDCPLPNTLNILDDTSIASGNFKTKLSKIRIHVLLTARSKQNWTVDSIVSDIKNLEVSNIQCDGDKTFQTICNCLITKNVLVNLFLSLLTINLKCQLESLLNNPAYVSMRCTIFTPPSR